MPLMTGFHLPGENDSALIAIKAPWVGADNTNHFFTHQELFNTSKTALGVAPAQVVAGNDFSDRLLTAGNGASTYDRYTFYRLLSQLGTDSAPERNKININYSNAVAYFNANEVPTNITIIPGAEANFTAWTPIQFFTIAADKMLRTYSQEWLVSNPQSFTNTFGAITTNVFGITNIPVLINNRFVYTPAVQRVLQLAANIYDATTNNLTVVGNNSRDFPSVFRPIFWVTNENGYANVYINGYEQVASVTGAGDPQLALPVNVADLLLGASVVNYPNGVNVYGVPWIIGAKKGFPNFNEFSMENIVGVTRRLNFTRPTVNAASGAPDLTNFRTNQMYTMCISNLLGVECWNSYTNNYVPVSGNLNIVVRDTLSMTLTNDDGMFPVTTGNIPLNNTKNITFPSYWPGSPLPWDGDGNPSPNSFDIPLLANVVMQLNPPLSPFPGYPGWWAYRFNTHEFLPVPLNPIFETGISGFPFPHFGLLTTNRLQVFMLDGPITGVYHVIDYAHFAGPESARNLTAEIFTDDANGVWNTNASTVGVPNGINNQFSISDVGVLSDAQIREDGIWHPDPEAKPLGGSIADQAAFFDAFFEPGNKSISTSSATVVNLATNVQAPYAPTRYVIEYITWQANDPLVHYIASDLNFTLPPSGDALTPGNNTFNYGKTIPTLTDTNANLGRLNNHYKPWGRSMLAPGTDTNACHLAIKDPLVWQSDDWDFPTNKFPTAGWLGRVHRGTPWQTVYLKSTDILMETNVLFPNIGFTTWTNWSGDLNPFDAINFAPVQDRRLFDFFTTAFNDNATRGQLSVNVGAPNGPSLAAWSALFSGVIALSNNAVSTAPGGISSFNPLTEEGVQRNGSLANFMALPPIDPAGTAGAGSVLGGLVANINATREAFTNVYGVPAFEHVGDILAVPQLTVQSPFLNRSDSIQQMNGISDEMYEWLPQQVMSLLRCSSSPRYVIYSYGQTLKPAPNSIYTGSGPFFQMVTNYQVISETATRAVVRFNSTLTNVVSTDTSGAFTVTNQVINNNAVIEGFNVLPPD